MAKEKVNMYLLAIVAIVAVVGIVVLVMNAAGGFYVSDDLSGQVLKVSTRSSNLNAESGCKTSADCPPGYACVFGGCYNSATTGRFASTD